MKSVVISSKKAPAPGGPYSQGVRRGNILAVGGQVGTDPQSGLIVEGVGEQIRQAMKNIQQFMKKLVPLSLMWW